MNSKYQIPKLRDLCLFKLVVSDITTISFSGIPPHLIRQILVKASPTDLVKIQNGPNSALPGFHDIMEEQWHRIVLAKYWSGRREPLILPDGMTWFAFYNQKKSIITQERRNSRFESEKDGSKTKRFIDISEVNQKQLISRNRSNSHSFKRSVNTAGMGRLAKDLYKKLR